MVSLSPTLVDDYSRMLAKSHEDLRSERNDLRKLNFNQRETIALGAQRESDLRSERDHLHDKLSSLLELEKELRKELGYERMERRRFEDEADVLRKQLRWWKAVAKFDTDGLDMSRHTITSDAIRILARLPANSNNDDAYQSTQRRLAVHVLQETIKLWGDSGEDINTGSSGESYADDGGRGIGCPGRRNSDAGIRPC